MLELLYLPRNFSNKILLAFIMIACLSLKESTQCFRGDGTLLYYYYYYVICIQ